MVSGLSASSWIKTPEPFPATTTLLCLAKLVLTLNNISFNSSHFLQTMDTRMGPSYACLFVEYVEHSLFHSQFRPLPTTLSL
eukprot:g26046.t1